MLNVPNVRQNRHKIALVLQVAADGSYSDTSIPVMLSDTDDLIIVAPQTTTDAAAWDVTSGRLVLTGYAASDIVHVYIETDKHV